MTVSALSHINGNKPLRPKWLKTISHTLVVIGAAQLMGAVGMRLAVHENERMAWTAAESIQAALGVQAGRVYPPCMAAELLLEIMGMVIPLGVAGMAHALEKHSFKRT